MRSLSVRYKLVVVIGASLTAISLFILLFFPPRMESISRGWAERRARDVTNVIADQVKAQLAFESDTQANETLNGMRTAADTAYAVVLKPDGSVFAGWDTKEAPAIASVPDTTRIAYRGDVID